MKYNLTFNPHMEHGFTEYEAVSLYGKWTKDRIGETNANQESPPSEHA